MDRPFEGLSDDWLDDLAVAVDSAYGEGAFGNAELAAALRQEFVERQRLVPMAYSNRRQDPESWIYGL